MEIPPTFYRVQAPDEEQRAMDILRHNLRRMGSYVREFQHAAMLMQFVNSNDELFKDNMLLGSAWRILGAKQSILAVYNYSMAAKGARTQLRIAKAVSALVDHSVLERATEEFKSQFPKLGELRQTVLHQGENLWNEERDRANRNRDHYVGPLGKVAPTNAIQSSLAGDVYHATFSGEVVTFEASMAKVQILDQLCIYFFSAFPDP